MCKDPAKCKTRCTSTFTPEQQAELLTKFWERQQCMVGRYEFINRHVDESAIQRHRAQHDERRSVARKFHLPGTDGKIQVSQIACQLLAAYRCWCTPMLLQTLFPFAMPFSSAFAVLLPLACLCVPFCVVFLLCFCLPNLCTIWSRFVQASSTTLSTYVGRWCRRRSSTLKIDRKSVV